MVPTATYRSARTADIGWNGPGTNPYRLKIVGSQTIHPPTWSPRT